MSAVEPLVAPNGKPFSPCGCGVPNDAPPSAHKPGCFFAGSKKKYKTIHEAVDPTAAFVRNWHEALVTADEALKYERAELVAKSRALERSNGMLSAAYDTLADKIVGHNFKCQPRVAWKLCEGMSASDADELNAAIRCAHEIDWEGTGHFLDAREQRTGTMIASAGLLCRVGSGDAMASIEHMNGPLDRHRPFSCAVKLFDPLRVFTPDLAKFKNNKNIYAGILCDARGREAAFYVHNYLEGCKPVRRTGRKPEEDFQRIAARDKEGRPRVIHVWDRRFDPEAKRGRPLVTPIMPSFKGYEQLRKGMLKSAVVQSNIAAVITSTLPDWKDMFVGDADKSGLENYMDEAQAWASGQGGITIDDTLIPRLYPHEDVNYKAPHQAFSSFDPFAMGYHAEQARQLGMGMSEYTGRYDRINFSAAKMETLKGWMRANVERRMTPGELMSGIYFCWLEEKLEKGLIPYPRSMQARLNTRRRRRQYWKQYGHCLAVCRWFGAGREEADDLKAAAAAKIWSELGVMTDREILANRGIDFDEHMDEMKYELGRKLECINLQLELAEAQGRLQVNTGASADSRFSTETAMTLAMQDNPDDRSQHTSLTQ